MEAAYAQRPFRGAAMTLMRDTLDRLGLSSMRASKLLDVNDRTVRSWCSEDNAIGHRRPPGPVLLLLELIEHLPEVRKYLARRKLNAERPHDPRP